MTCGLTRHRMRFQHLRRSYAGDCWMITSIFSREAKFETLISARAFFVREYSTDTAHTRQY